MARTKPGIYATFIAHYRDATLPEPAYALFKPADQNSQQQLLIASQDNTAYHALISTAENGLITYRQRDGRRSPSGWTHNFKNSQPNLTLRNFAHDTLEMLLDSLQHGLPAKLNRDPEDTRNKLANILYSALTKSRAHPPRFRDLKKRLQTHFDNACANNPNAHQTLRQTIGAFAPEDTWTINQYNATLSIPELLAQAAARAPHILRTYMLQTVNASITPPEQYPATIQDLARITGWDRVSQNIRTRPPETTQAKLRVAAAAVRDANVPDHCATTAQAIWADTELHWDIRQKDLTTPSTWDRWNQLLHTAFQKHPKETEIHRDSQDKYQEALSRGTPQERKLLTGRTSCLAHASQALATGHDLLRRAEHIAQWPTPQWQSYIDANFPPDPQN